MKIRRFTLAMALLLATGVPAEAGAQSGHDLLQQALVMERAEGNLDGAVGLYNRILAEHHPRYVTEEQGREIDRIAEEAQNWLIKNWEGESL